MADGLLLEIVHLFSMAGAEVAPPPITIEDGLLKG